MATRRIAQAYLDYVENIFSIPINLIEKIDKIPNRIVTSIWLFLE